MPPARPVADTAPCPCGTGDSFGACCGPLLDGTRTAPTAERLMRSRYTAFAVGDLDYLLASWDTSTRPIALRDDPAQRWTGLTVLGATGGGLFDAVGTVEFEADYVRDRRPGALRENSRFERRGGRWRYVRPEATNA